MEKKTIKKKILKPTKKPPDLPLRTYLPNIRFLWNEIFSPRESLWIWLTLLSNLALNMQHKLIPPNEILFWPHCRISKCIIAWFMLSL
jgi:hypothetical protein